MRRAELSRKLIFACLFLSGASWLSGEEDILEKDILPALQGVTARNDFFEVIADDMLSAQYAATVGEMLAKRFSEMLPPPDSTPQPVLVTLAPAASFEWESNFVTRVYPGGQVKVSMPWEKTTSREIMERALAQGYLTHLAAAYTKGAVTVPLWLELAVQHLARIQTMPTHSRFLAAQVNARVSGGAVGLEEILLAERGNGADPVFAAHAYWLLIFLEQEGQGRGQLQTFLVRLLRGEAPLVAMNAAYGEHLRSASEAEMWWLVGLNELTRSRGSPLLPVDESRRRLMEFPRFTFELEGGESRLFAEDLWTHRTSASLQDELRYRGQVMALAKVSFHPYYQNAVLSLDQIFEAVLADNEEQYREALVAFRHDLRTGDELAEDTASILDDLRSELAP
ncbi:MAG: hypothetical protein WD490_07445 [Opitutales bacterium]